MDRFSRIQAARDLRLAKLQRGDWRVVKFNDRGVRITVSGGLTEKAADGEAGRRRDTQSEQSINEGWSFVAERQR